MVRTGKSNLAIADKMKYERRRVSLIGTELIASAIIEVAGNSIVGLQYSRETKKSSPDEPHRQVHDISIPFC